MHTLIYTNCLCDVRRSNVNAEKMTNSVVGFTPQKAKIEKEYMGGPLFVDGIHRAVVCKYIECTMSIYSYIHIINIHILHNLEGVHCSGWIDEQNALSEVQKFTYTELFTLD